MERIDEVNAWWAAAVKRLQQIGSGVWCPIYESRPVDGIGRVALFSWLASPSDWPAQVQTESLTGWDVSPNGFAPYLADGELSSASSGGCLPIAVRDEFEHTHDSTWFPAEDLRMAFRLRPNETHTSFLEADDAGDEQEVLRFSEKLVEIRTSLLLRYAAARQADVIFSAVIDLNCRSDGESPDGLRLDEGDCRAQGLAGGEYLRFVGRKRIQAPSVEESGLYPFEVEQEHLDFIVGEDATGMEIEACCGDASYANSEVPYLTPVFFSREVIRRYRESPSQFLVRDGMISHAASLWSLRSVDMNHTDHVVAYLGDLKSLPTKEQRHWRTHNIKPTGRGLSETQFRRDILGEFADPSSHDLLLRQRYPEVNSAWSTAFGAPLWREPHADDSTILDQISLLIAEDVSEFDAMTIRLQKVLVDFLNGDSLDPGSSGSIQRLETTLDRLGFPDSANRLVVLRTLQGLRSKGAAHRRGSDFDFAKAGVDNLKDGWASILGDAVQLLESLLDFANSRPI